MGIPSFQGMFRGIQGCSEVVLGVFQGVLRIFRGVLGRSFLGCSGPVLGFTDTPFYWLKSLKYFIRSK